MSAFYWGDYLAMAIALLGIGLVSGLFIARHAVLTHLKIADQRSAYEANHWTTTIREER